MPSWSYIRIVHSPFGRMFVSLDPEVTAQLIDKFAEFLQALGGDAVACGLTD